MSENLLINGVYWGEITPLLTIDPNFLVHPSTLQHMTIPKIHGNSGEFSLMFPRNHKTLKTRAGKPVVKKSLKFFGACHFFPSWSW